jgi:excisionase family DNA binding protein
MSVITDVASQRQLLTPEETADLLRVKVQTLAAWRCTKRTSLRWVKVGRRVLYPRQSVEAFLRANTHGGLVGTEIEGQ